MALERGRPASSVDRALEGWRREAIKARETIAAIQDELNDTIAERDSLMRDLEATRRDLSQLEVRHQELRLEHQIIVGLIRATEARKAANNG